MAFDFPNSPTVGQDYQGYVWDGQAWAQSFNSPNQSGVIGITVFTASGTYVPRANMTTCLIECVGGGGAGGGVGGIASVTCVGGGGGGGGFARKFATAADIGPSKPVTIGAAGIGVSNATGGTGGTTSVGTLASATGGTGGAQLGAGSTPGIGGIGTVGNFIANGATGEGGIWQVAVNLVSGGGASSMFGGGGPSRLVGGGTVGVGNNATGYGAGGAGAGSQNNTGNAAGGNGSPGLVVITEYGMTSLSASTAAQGAVRYDLPQGLTSNQQSQARANIGALKKNYLINGAMMISQENGTTAGTTNNYYPVDQFYVSFSNVGAVSIAQVASVTTAGSPNRLRVTVTTADAAVAAVDSLGIVHSIEGLRMADLNAGAAAAKTITVQFGVKAPAGTYCVSLRNGSGNRSYVAEFVISAGEANTDVVKSAALAMDATGTWAKDNTVGVYLQWSLMCGSTFQTPANAWTAGNFLATSNQFNFMGTVGNIFELFDVSLTEGTVAPPFQVPDYASELALCRRYWQKSYSYQTALSTITHLGTSTLYVTPLAVGGASQAGFSARFGNLMRSAPSVTAYSPRTGAVGKMADDQAGADVNVTVDTISDGGFRWYGGSVAATGIANFSVHWKADSRL